MPTVLLGNTAPIEVERVPTEDESEAVAVEDVDGKQVLLKDERIARPDLGNRITTFEIPEDMEPGEALTVITSVYASHHSDDPPEWVESDEFADLLSAHYSRGEHTCRVGRPRGWKEG